LFSENAGPYNSWGNGAAMRVSPVGFALDRVEDVLELCYIMWAQI
jgi:ADP-ribosylglycohydrolase